MTSPSQVLEAIHKCRQKLDEDPDFVKAHQMLSVLLKFNAIKVSYFEHDEGSQIHDDDDMLIHRFQNRLWEEVANSSWKAAVSTTQHGATGSISLNNDEKSKSNNVQQPLSSSSSLDDATRAECLLRSARALTYLTSSSPSDAADGTKAVIYRLVDVYSMLLPFLVDVNDVEAVLTRATPLFFSKTTASMMSRSMIQFDDLVKLARVLVDRFPTSIFVNQFQGAVFRKTGDLMNAYHAYSTSAKLAQQEFHEKQEQDIDVEFVEMVVQSHIFAASAMNEVGTLPLEDKLLLLDSALSMLDKLKDNEGNKHNAQTFWSSSIALLRVELYNTFGVIQKAAGNTQDAIVSFRRSST
jgi:hypothetical protein